MKRWMALAGVVGLVLMALAVPGGTRAQESLSQGCEILNYSIYDTLYYQASRSAQYAAGDHVKFTAGSPTIGSPTTISFFFDSFATQTVFPGTIEYIMPSDGFYTLTWSVDRGTGATWTVSCEPGPPPPTTPTCFGQDATIYVKDGKIVGGPDNGKSYKGKLKGTNGADVIVGTDGNDTIEGKDGNDLICGLAGNDTLRGNDKDDRIDGGAGNDKVDGGDGKDTLIGGEGDDKLQGNDGTDTLDGGAGNDRLEGGASSDTLTGGAGADKFSGGPDKDMATDYTPGEGDTQDSIP